MEGIGEATALALALTESLGGRRHDSLASLRAWAQTGDHSAQLEAYLLYRRENNPRAQAPVSLILVGHVAYKVHGLC